MREDDPFEGWLFFVELSRTDPLPERPGRDLGTGLRRLAKLLAEAPPGKVDYNNISGGALSISTHSKASRMKPPKRSACFTRSGSAAGRASATCN
jgi:hypothetical protein